MILMYSYGSISSSFWEGLLKLLHRIQCYTVYISRRQPSCFSNQQKIPQSFKGLPNNQRSEIVNQDWWLEKTSLEPDFYKLTCKCSISLMFSGKLLISLLWRSSTWKKPSTNWIKYLCKLKFKQNRHEQS